MGFSWITNLFGKLKEIGTFSENKHLMNTPALCWFSNHLYSQVHVRQVPDDIFWWRRNAPKTRLVLFIWYMYNFCTNYFWTKCKLSYICNVMVVYCDYYVHWIWYTTWSQPRKCFRLWFSGCDRLVSEPLFIVNKVYQTLHGIKL